MTGSEEFIFSSLASDPDYRDLVEMYVDEMPARIQNIREAFQSTDRERLVRLIHQLKGAAGSYGFIALTEEAAMVEKHLLAGTTSDEEQIISRLITLCERVRSGTADSAAPQEHEHASHPPQ